MFQFVKVLNDFLKGHSGRFCKFSDGVKELATFFLSKKFQFLIVHNKEQDAVKSQVCPSGCNDGIAMRYLSKPTVLVSTPRRLMAIGHSVVVPDSERSCNDGTAMQYLSKPTVLLSTQRRLTATGLSRRHGLCSTTAD